MTEAQVEEFRSVVEASILTREARDDEAPDDTYTINADLDTAEQTMIQSIINQVNTRNDTGDLSLWRLVWRVPPTLQEDGRIRMRYWFEELVPA